MIATPTGDASMVMLPVMSRSGAMSPLAPTAYEVTAGVPPSRFRPPVYVTLWS